MSSNVPRCHQPQRVLETGFNIGQSAAMILTTLSLAGVDAPSCVVAALEAPRDGYPPPPFFRTNLGRIRSVIRDRDR